MVSIKKSKIDGGYNPVLFYKKEGVLILSYGISEKRNLGKFGIKIYMRLELKSQNI